MSLYPETICVPARKLLHSEGSQTAPERFPCMPDVLPPSVPAPRCSAKPPRRSILSFYHASLRAYRPFTALSRVVIMDEFTPPQGSVSLQRTSSFCSQRVLADHSQEHNAAGHCCGQDQPVSQPLRLDHPSLL